MLNTYYFYILKCSDKSYYTGSTTDLKARIDRHNQGRGGTHTAKKRPVQLVHHERFSSYDDAKKRERQVKKWSRAKKEALIRGDMEKLREISQSK